MPEPTVRTIGEWTGKVRFHGIAPEYVHSDSPAETYAFLTVENDAANASIPVIKGDKGEKGDPTPALQFQDPIEDSSELPTGLTASDAGKAYWVRNSNDAWVWNGTEFKFIDGMIIQGPQGVPGESIVGPQGPVGPAGPIGPEGPSAAILTASDYGGTASPNPGDVLLWDGYEWVSRRPLPAAHTAAVNTGSSQYITNLSLNVLGELSFYPETDMAMTIMLPQVIQSSLTRPDTAETTNCTYNVEVRIDGVNKTICSANHYVGSGSSSNADQNKTLFPSVNASNLAAITDPDFGYIILPGNSGEVRVRITAQRGGSGRSDYQYRAYPIHMPIILTELS